MVAKVKFPTKKNQDTTIHEKANKMQNCDNLTANS